MKSADDYRNRPSAEILQEQKELAKLRHATLLKGNAWWAWSAETHAFTVAPAWEKLTGYKADEIFPQELSPYVKIEDLLDNFIDRWLEIVADPDRVKAKKAAENFLLFKSKSSVFDLSYLLKTADGKEKLVLSEGRSVWENGRLIEIFITIRDIDKYRTVEEASKAIARNENIAAANAAEIKQVKADSITFQTIKNNAGLISTWGTIALAFLVTFNDLAEQVKSELARSWAIWRSPAVPAEVPPSRLLPAWLGADDIKKAEEVLISLAPSNIKAIRLVAYSPGHYPALWQVLAEITYGDFEPVFDWGLHRITDIPEPARAKADNHVSSQSFSYTSPLNELYKESSPFSIELPNGSVQIFYVEIVTSQIDSSAIEETKSATLSAAADVAAIFEPIPEED